MFELIQNRQPVKGDKILLFCTTSDSWQIVSLTSNVLSRYLSKGWFYNYRFQDGSTGGNYLHPGQPYWGLLTENQANRIALDKIAPTLGNERVDQLDGGITPDSLTPDNSVNESNSSCKMTFR